jgi:cell division protein FtsI/penicillin-binding protein 2
MALRSGSRSKRAGAHRAPRTVPSARPPRVSGTKPGKARITDSGIGLRLKSRAVIVRTSVVVVLAAIVGVGIANGGGASAEPTVYKFLLDWQSKQYLQAALLTTGQPHQVASELAGAYRELDASDLNLAMQSIVQHGNTADARFDASIDLGSSGLPWSYEGGFSLRQGGSGWQIVWHPSVIMPELEGNERLAVLSTELPRAQIEDSSGQSLTIRSVTYEVGVIPGRLADPAFTAARIAALTGLPADQVQGQIEAAPTRVFLELITLPPSDTKLRSELSVVPGVVVKPVVKQLFDSIAPDVVGNVGTENASPLRQNGLPYLPGTTVGLSGLQQTFQRQLTGTPRTEVVIQRAGVPVAVLKMWKGSLGTPVRTTLNSSVQLAADRALAGLPASAAIVAVAPGNGQILAVASHKGGGMPPLDPLAGQYQPGQAFTIVSAAAILASGVTPSRTIPCYQNNQVEGQSFVNDPPVVGLGGNATFGKDFAYACSTAFAGLSMYLTPTDLAKAAAKFGVNGWDLPLSSFFPGTIGQPGSGVDLAQDTIGVGKVRMSPLGMALAAAVVDSGRWHGPSLVEGEPDPGTAPQGVMSPQVLSSLRELMHKAATTGAGRAANVGGSVYGQVGDASFAGQLHISWFVGYQANGIAFAVVELGKTASDSAAPLAGSFLRHIGAGS